MIHVLFLCTGNSARSILGEALLNAHPDASGRFRAFSAGSHPRGAIHPVALEVLAARGVPSDGLRSKSWDEYAGPETPAIDIVITVCDDAAAETCPVWPGHPVTVHWGLPDPAAVEGSEEGKRAAFDTTAATLQSRIAQLVALPLETMPPDASRAALAGIAREA
jgi:arsenate reductase (thioredoxin)